MTAFRLQGDDAYAKVYNRGLDEETRILSFLSGKGFKITATEDIEDQNRDIDFFIGSSSVSIKAEHSGLKYGNIYVELATQRWQPHQWKEGQREQVTEWGKIHGYRKRNDILWRPGWWFSGCPEYYLIAQGKHLRLYLKEHLKQFISENGFKKFLGLSWKVLEKQGGKDTICGYLNVSEVPIIQEWELPETENVIDWVKFGA